MSLESLVAAHGRFEGLGRGVGERTFESFDEIRPEERAGVYARVGAQVLPMRAADDGILIFIGFPVVA